MERKQYDFLELESDQLWQQGSTRFEQKDGPAITPSLFFTDEEVKLVNWDTVFAQW